MKVHPVNFFVALVVSALLSYGIFSIDANHMKGVIGIGSFVFMAITLAAGIGLSFTDGRAGVNVKLISMIFFVLSLLLNLLFAFLTFSQVSYVITAGILFLIYVLIANGIYGAV
ncbi:hypothetical protein HUU62_23005 [Rhodoferax sp. 4810]|nr:hypothetical protein [Rhodoferax jenense]